MTFPSFTADQSLYRSGRHYHSLLLTATARGVIISQCGDAALPFGSYLQSCVGCTCNDDALLCNCYDFNGTIQGTTALAPVSNCVGDIYNSNGNLGCSPF
jgi:hypothetical protein